jgi:two-component system LytT family response regulator
MRTLIIDDELECRRASRLIAEKYCPEMQIVGEADGVESGITAIHNLNPELVLLDVQMQDGTGFDLISRFSIVSFKIIFITSFDQFALKAFRYSALDYLLKPIEPELFIRAFYKAREQNLINTVKQQVELHLSTAKMKQRLALPTIEGLEIINIENIIYCESDSNYTNFYLNNKSKFMVSKTMKEYEDLFPEDSFVRIHKSYIVNLHYITKYVRGDGGDIILSNGTTLPVARLRKEKLIEKLRLL